MIEMTHKYQTRDGHPVRILCTDRDERNSGSCLFPVVGLVEHGGERELMCWTNTGSRKGYDCDDVFDLVPVPTKHEAWAVVIDDHVFPGPCMVFNTKEGAEHHAEVCAGRLAYVAHVTWED